MAAREDDFASKFDLNFRLFLELMAYKVKEILLVSSAYDAFIIEEDGSLASRIINEYSGLNLSKPPRVTRASSAVEALELFAGRPYDLVIVTPHLDDLDAFSLGQEIKRIRSDVPVYLLSHNARGIGSAPERIAAEGIDKTFLWMGNADLLLAIVKNTEDERNVDFDTRQAMVRVLILVEDSPLFYSSMLPFIYHEVVHQTQAVLERGLNEEHKLLTMRARPKILLARTYEEALEYYDTYREFLLGIISDTRFPVGGAMKDNAGLILLSKIRNEMPYLPLLMTSTESDNREKAGNIPAEFVDKNSPALLAEVRDFFLNHLGFGDFIFRAPDGNEIGRAANLRELEFQLNRIPDDSLLYHAEHNHFSSWIMARSEITLASIFREKSVSDFSSTDEVRNYLISQIHALRKWRQKGVITSFDKREFDPDITDFTKVGNGSMGGKARGLAFMADVLRKKSEFRTSGSEVTVDIPKTLVVCTDAFESFVSHNHLEDYASGNVPDEEIAEAFFRAKLPGWLEDELKAYLSFVDYPLAVRASSLLQDAHFNPFVGLYDTFMIPNNHSNFEVRFGQLASAIKLVYASTWYEAPLTFSRNTQQKQGEDAMAVIVQQIAGEAQGEYFYPAISGVVRSHNFYAMPPMKPEDGVAYLSLGFGKADEDGGLRLSPRYPTVLPQFSTVDDILDNAQRFFYALRVNDYSENLNRGSYCNLDKRKINDAADEWPVKLLSSTYDPQSHSIQDTGFISGPKIVTFARILKHNLVPLPGLMSDLLEIARNGLGCPCEIEFAVNMDSCGETKANFYILQVRPMVTDEESLDIKVTEQDMKRAFCFSTHALGNGKREDIADVVYVKPRDFKLNLTVEISREVSEINNRLIKERRPYLLMGPGRWGSADRWLGIPVRWEQISGAEAIVELRNEQIKADASRGYHFLRYITSQGIPYISITEGSDEYIDWDWLESLPAIEERTFLRHVRLEKPLLLKIDGKKSHCVCLKP